MPITQPTILTGGEAKEKDAKLQEYLESMEWYENDFPNEKIEAMLAASCLRFLVGIAEISFVVGFAEEIIKKQKDTLNLSLHYATEILQEVSAKLENNTVRPEDTNTIHELVNDAQEVITNRRFTPASNS